MFTFGHWWSKTEQKLEDAAFYLFSWLLLFFANDAKIGSKVAWYQKNVVKRQKESIKPTATAANYLGRTKKRAYLFTFFKLNSAGFEPA